MWQTHLDLTAIDPKIAWTYLGCDISWSCPFSSPHAWTHHPASTKPSPKSVTTSIHHVYKEPNLSCSQSHVCSWISLFNDLTYIRPESNDRYNCNTTSVGKSTKCNWRPPVKKRFLWKMVFLQPCILQGLEYSEMHLHLLLTLCTGTVHKVSSKCKCINLRNLAHTASACIIAKWPNYRFDIYELLFWHLWIIVWHLWKRVAGVQRSAGVCIFCWNRNGKVSTLSCCWDLAIRFFCMIFAPKYCPNLLALCIRCQ